MAAKDSRSLPSHPAPPAETLFFQTQKKAMATIFEVLLPIEASQAEAEWAVDALEQVPPLEQNLTVYRADSEISRLNAADAGQWVPLSEETFRILQHADRFYRQTDGAFDVTAGALVDIWGFTQRTGRKPERSEIEAARATVGTNHLEIDEERRAVRKLLAELRVNLGAIGKGFAIDRVASQLLMWGSANFCVHAGQSSIAARGAMNAKSDCWEIALRHPTHTAERLGRIRLRNRAIGTSGSGQQFFHFRGRRYGHVIDPRTGWPAGDLLSLTVLAPDATSADALATGLFVLGREELTRYAADHPELGFIAVGSGRRAGDVTLLALNVDDAWEPTSKRIVDETRQS